MPYHLKILRLMSLTHAFTWYTKRYNIRAICKLFYYFVNQCTFSLMASQVLIKLFSVFFNNISLWQATSWSQNERIDLDRSVLKSVRKPVALRWFPVQFMRLATHLLKTFSEHILMLTYDSCTGSLYTLFLVAVFSHCLSFIYTLYIRIRQWLFATYI